MELGRRPVQILGWTLIWSGVLIFGYLGWQLWGTDLVNARVQAEAEQVVDDQLDRAREALPAPEVVEVDDGEVVEFHAEQAPDEGVVIGTLRVPRVALEVVVFAGVSSETLKKGPGLMSGTPMPGQPGNAVISGHRTTYGRPFFDFDQLAEGDRIELETAIGLHRYEVRESFIVEPTDVWVTEDRPGGWLTLTTCHPKFSARERLIITAELVEGPNLAYVEDLVGRLQQVS